MCAQFVARWAPLAVYVLHATRVVSAVLKPVIRWLYPHRAAKFGNRRVLLLPTRSIPLLEGGLPLHCTGRHRPTHVAMSDCDSMVYLNDEMSAAVLDACSDQCHPATGGLLAHDDPSTYAFVPEASAPHRTPVSAFHGRTPEKRAAPPLSMQVWSRWGCCARRGHAVV